MLWTHSPCNGAMQWRSCGDLAFDVILPVITSPAKAKLHCGLHNSRAFTMRFLYVCAVLVAIVATIVTLPWEDTLKYEFIAGPLTTPESGPLDTPAYTRSIVHFTSQGTRCEAWFYLPKASPERPPVVVMGHGIGTSNCAHPITTTKLTSHFAGAQKDMSLHNYASRFASDGMAVFVFDYRNYGGSDGHPRHWSSPKRHLQDWTAAYNYIKVPRQHHPDPAHNQHRPHQAAPCRSMPAHDSPCACISGDGRRGQGGQQPRRPVGHVVCGRARARAR
jgi:hypothetical protein